MSDNKKRKTIEGWFDLINGLVPHGGIVELPVLSGSMSPLIKPGTAVRIRSISARDITIGDIIVFNEKNSLTTHRLLVRIPPWGASLLYQKGDANRFGSWIPGSRVVGIVDYIRDDTGAYLDLSSPASKKEAGRNARRQIVLTLRDIALIPPRFIKKCLTR